MGCCQLHEIDYTMILLKKENKKINKEINKISYGDEDEI